MQNDLGLWRDGCRESGQVTGVGKQSHPGKYIQCRVAGDGTRGHLVILQGGKQRPRDERLRPPPRPRLRSPVGFKPANPIRVLDSYFCPVLPCSTYKLCKVDTLISLSASVSLGQMGVIKYTCLIRLLRGLNEFVCVGIHKHTLHIAPDTA